MDFSLPPLDDSRRLAVRGFLSEHPGASQKVLAKAGLVAPGWPRPWGLGADVVHQLIIAEELEEAGLPPPKNAIGIGWAGPTILAAGSSWQKQRYLGPLLAGDEAWCQLFSEPGSGSDLASLTTRAERDGDEWVVNGQKVWTTWAGEADYGILLARTDPTVPKHQGISYFICPMHQSGIDIRPVQEMTGGHHFNEVFLADARIPGENLVGDPGQGWALARVTLGNERISLSTGGVVWGMGPRTRDLIDLVASAKVDDEVLIERLANVHVVARVIELLGLRILSELIAGRQPGPAAAVKKLLADRHGQVVMGLAKDLTGAFGLTVDQGPLGAAPVDWHWGFLFSPALTIGGGTAEVLRNIIGETMLGLPREARQPAPAATRS